MEEKANLDVALAQMKANLEKVLPFESRPPHSPKVTTERDSLDTRVETATSRMQHAENKAAAALEELKVSEMPRVLCSYSSVGEGDTGGSD